MLGSMIGLIALISVILWATGSPAWECFRLFMTYSFVIFSGWILWIAFVYYIIVAPLLKWLML